MMINVFHQNMRHNMVEGYYGIFPEIFHFPLKKKMYAS